jgi:hypothetical protein
MALRHGTGTCKNEKGKFSIESNIYFKTGIYNMINLCQMIVYRNYILWVFSTLYRHICFDVWMGVVIAKCKVVKGKREDVCNGRIELHCW